MRLPVADRWFERRTVGPDLTLLTSRTWTESFGAISGTYAAATATCSSTPGLGIASLTSAAGDLFEKPLAAVATHTHMDHTGGMHEFAERFVLAIEAKHARPRREPHPARHISSFGRRARDARRPRATRIPGTILTAVPHHGFDPRAHSPLPAPPTRLLTEGDVVDLGNRSFEVLHLPGHSPGSIGLWEKATGVLFSGDAIYDGPLLDELPGRTRRLRHHDEAPALPCPLDVVHGGHEPSFGRGRLIEIVDAYLARRGA
jgi:glyoxylase-like metal-dependent hydrolase (beta-lactamase superfamily II)